MGRARASAVGSTRGGGENWTEAVGRPAQAAMASARVVSNDPPPTRIAELHWGWPLGTRSLTAGEYRDRSQAAPGASTVTPMLHLAEATAPQWAPWAVEHMDDILLDHAHCEKKAASTAMNLIFRYQDKLPLMVPLSRLAREELAHFELVLGHLQRRGIAFSRQEPSTYASELMKIVRSQEPLRLLDTLLCCAMIEARSCERMQLLAEALTDRDPELSALYGGLLASEARHHASYVELIRALGLADAHALKERLRHVSLHEASVIANAPAQARMHAAHAALNSTSA